MKTWIYSWIAYPILFAFAYGISFFNKKMRKTLELRAWKEFLSLRFNPSKSIEYWLHVSSQGELEYAIPLIVELSKRGKQVLITYYSISAKDAVERLPAKYENVALVVPLPHDGLGLMKEFVKMMKAQGLKYLLLMKYELWPGLLWECNAHRVKVMLVDALKPSWFHRKLIHKVDAILSGYDSEIKGVSHNKMAVVGDTRVERVLQRINENRSALMSMNTVPSSKLMNQCVVLGSMWPEDDELLIRSVTKLKKHNKLELDLIWVPHELSIRQEKNIRKNAANVGFKIINWDEFSSEKFIAETGQCYFIIVMKKGILAEIYSLAHKAYVGGGFGAGVHSVWEPMLAGAFVGCGPEIKRSPEATMLCQKGVLNVIYNEDDFIAWIENIQIGSRDKISKIGNEVRNDHSGASNRIIDFCEDNFK